MIKIIVAISRNGVIGCKGRMPWHLPEDLRRFKELTMGGVVVMGRKTFESIGKPLPGRINVVITRNQDFEAAGIEVVHSLEQAVEKYPDAFIIGGAEIYARALPLAGELYITRIDADYDGDTSFPKYDGERWTLVSRERREGFDFLHYKLGISTTCSMLRRS